MKISNRFVLLIAFVALLVGSRPGLAESPTTASPCTNGFAKSYPCHNIDLLSHLTLAQIGAGEGIKGNDIWGWTDPQNGKEYVLFGLTDGMSFIDISDPINPVYVGKLPTQTSNAVYRDMYVYQDYAFVVADQPSLHGMQVFDLDHLRHVTNPPETFTADVHYTGFGNGHNIFINEDTGYGYVTRTEQCGGALTFVDVNDPLNPQPAGCYAADGIASDMQCVTYNGPDGDHTGREVCFIGNDDSFHIADVTDKANPVALAANISYPGLARAHQGWLTQDQAYFLLSDVDDEHHFGTQTRTYILDVRDLDNPVYLDTFWHDSYAHDHNLYVLDQFVYEANFRAGLRILDATEVAAGTLSEVAYFDVDPAGDSPTMNGAWDNYPYYASGVVAIGDNDNGLFVVMPQLEPTDVSTVTFEGQGTGWGWVVPAGIALLFLLLLAFFGYGRLTKAN